MIAVGIASVALVWAGIATVTVVMNPVRRRLKALQSDATSAPVSSARATAAPGWTSLFRVFEPNKETERAGMQLKLMQAGFRTPYALGLAYSAKLITAAALPGAVFLGLYFGQKHYPLTVNIVIGFAAALLGSLLPDIFINRRFQARKAKLLEGLPDALDLLVTCTEAGLGLNAALERVVEQMPGSHPELAYELGQVNAEVRAGIDRNAALKNLGERTGLEEIHGLVSLISHSTRLGTGIASTLRIYAEDFRDRRMQRAEEIAATVGTKLMFPLLLCLFPAFFVVAVGPAIFGVMRALGK
jgi:tight adherence protein C